MPYRYEFEPALVRIITDGIIDGSLIAASGVGLYGHPHWRSHMAELWDFSEVTNVDVSPEAMQQILNVDAELPVDVGPGRTATLVASEDMYDIALLYGMMLADTPREHRVFWDRGEAERWLADPSGSLPSPAQSGAA